MALKKRAPKATKTKASAQPKAKKAAKKVTKAPAVTATARKSAKVINFPNKAITEKQSKAQIFAEIAEIAQVDKQDAKNVMSAIRNLIERHVKPKGSGLFILPELGIKVRRIQKKAVKARTGRNPFTGETIQIAAKPARKSVKVSATKSLKELVD